MQQTLELFRLMNAMKKSRPDALLPYTWLPNVLCGIGWRLTGASACVWNQRDEGLNLRPNSIKHRIAVRLTPCFISNSHHGRNYLEQEFKIKKNKIATISNAVLLDPPIDNRRNWRAKLKASTNDFVACMVANIHPYKDHSTAIRAWKIVSERLARKGRRALLVFAGRDDGLGQEISTLASQLELTNDILFLGAVVDISGLLFACDIGVHSSNHEGCPNAILEEMAAGLPVVATNQSGNIEALGANARRWLAPYNDSETLAEKIIQLESDSNLLYSVGESNRIRIESEFNPTKCFGAMASSIFRSIYQLPLV